MSSAIRCWREDFRCRNEQGRHERACVQKSHWTLRPIFLLCQARSRKLNIDISSPISTPSCEDHETMRFMNSESANLLTSQGKFSRHTQSKRHTGLIAELVSDSINCALAHWYLLPGLELQRCRLRLAFSLIRTPDAARRAFSTLPATLCLDSDFALKSLRTQPRVGSYLDVSSPWLFPFYVLKAFKPDRALLLNASGTTRNLLKQLANETEANATELLTK